MRFSVKRTRPRPRGGVALSWSWCGSGSCFGFTHEQLYVVLDVLERHEPTAADADRTKPTEADLLVRHRAPDATERRSLLDPVEKRLVPGLSNGHRHL